MAKKAMMRASNPGRASSSFGAGPDRKIARKMDALMSRSRRPILRIGEDRGFVKLCLYFANALSCELLT